MRVLRRDFVLTFFTSLTVFAGQEHDGNFEIRVEPTAVLQIDAPIPFSITVRDPLHKPVTRANVKFQIEDQNGGSVELFRATEISPGNYIAKPVFPKAGSWSIYVEVRRDLAMSARTLEYQVAR